MHITNKEVDDFRHEITEAALTSQKRAAFASIVNRNESLFRPLTYPERQKVCKDLGCPTSYTVEMYKALAMARYDRTRHGI